MDKETIKNMIDNSTWNSHDKINVFKFGEGNNLSINGKNHLHYSIHSRDDKIIILMGSGKSYNVEYVNDFILKLNNNDESFRIMPE